MANKKKPAPKKAAKPAPKAASKKPAAKKTVKKSASKPVVKKAAIPARPATAAKKPAHPAAGPARPSGAAAKSVIKPAAKPVSKPASVPAPAKKIKPAQPAAPVVKGVVKSLIKPAQPAVAATPKVVVTAAEKIAQPADPIPVKTGKPGQIDPKSLVTIKPKVQPVTKKEPPKPSKVVIPKTTTKSSVKYEPEFTKSVLDISAANYAANGPTMRYSDADLAEFREIIQKKLDAAKKELNYLQGLITRKEEGGDMDEGRYMTMEDGSVSMEREQLSQMASRQITFIDHLEKAMMRIENKTYGICRVTGKLIDKARLRAVPHATLSIEAKQMMNK
jgi:RNA polymerase-binding transcription factor DksA